MIRPSVLEKIKHVTTREVPIRDVLSPEGDAATPMTYSAWERVCGLHVTVTYRQNKLCDDDQAKLVRNVVEAQIRRQLYGEIVAELASITPELSDCVQLAGEPGAKVRDTIYGILEQIK